MCAPLSHRSAPQLPCSRPLALLSLAFLGFAALGCSTADPLVPVYGAVFVDGQPISGAAVAFHPAAGGACSVATTDISGRFSLRTQDGRLGAAPGLHRVAVSYVAEARGERSTQPQLRNASFQGTAVPNAEPMRETAVLSDSGFEIEVRAENMKPVFLKLGRQDPAMQSSPL